MPSKRPVPEELLKLSVFDNFKKHVSESCPEIQFSVSQF